MSRAFPNTAALKVVHRAPYANGWLLEEGIYQQVPGMTPERLAMLYFQGKVVAWHEVPADRVWILPPDGLDALKAEVR